MIIAAPLLVPFATAVGLPIAGLGAIEIGKKVQDFVDNNPEVSMEILTSLKDSLLMTAPGGQGLNTLFKKKAKEDSDDESVEVAPEDRTKEERAKEMKKRFKEGKGDKREIGKKGFEEVIKPVKDIEDLLEGEERYDGSLEDAPKPKFDYKKFFRNRNADGGAIGIEVLFEEKKDGGRIGFANGGDNIIGSTIDKFFSGPAMDTYTKDYMESVKAPSTFDYNIASNKAAGQFIQDKTKELLGDNPVSNVVGQAATYAGVPLSIMASPFYETAQIISDKRMEPGSGVKGFYDAFMDERPFSTAIERGAGVLQSTPLGEAIYNLGGKAADLVSGIRNTNIGDFFFAPAGAADFQGGEMLQTPGVMVDANEGFRTPTRTNVQSMDLEADLGTRINPNIQPQQNIFQRAGNVFSSIKDNIPNFGIMGLLSSLDRFDTLSPEDQAFILDQAGGNRPSKDRYGINRRSAFGNYAQYVRDKGIFAPGKRGEYYRSISGLDQALMDTLDREQKAKAAYEKQIRDAADAASRNAARARSITAGYGGSDDSRGATGPTASGAGMGVGGGYASDYGFAKGGLATMFVEKR
jgi:hypothetical protein